MAEKPVILLVQRKTDELYESLLYSFEGRCRIRCVHDGMSGLRECQLLKPAIVFIEDELPDISGMTISTTIKDMGVNQDTLVYLIGIRKLLPGTKADRFISAEQPVEIFMAQVKRDLNEIMKKAMDLSMEDAVMRQYDLLPQAITREETGDEYKVTSILSPFDKLSGDFFSYKHLSDENTNETKAISGTYGFLFDCPGHSLSSYGLVMAMTTSCQQGMWLYQTGIKSDLAETMAGLNENIIEFILEEVLIPTIIFHIDSKARLFRCCSAGIPSILVRRRGMAKREVVPTKSFILGYDIDSTFHEVTFGFDEVDEIVLITDGINDILADNYQDDFEPQKVAKHDDISAVFINFYHDD